jgi:hypothetical protein
MFNNSVNQIFQYNGSPITFQKGDSVMVNATEMAKPFGKLAKDWLSNKSTKEFLSTLSSVRTIPLTALVEIKQGGNKEQGTWMHEDVAMEFARWLSPAFAIWCNDRIKELLTIGMTATQPTLEQMIDNPDLVIHLATQLKQEREERAKLEAQTEQQQATIKIQTEEIKKSAPKNRFSFGNLRNCCIFAVLTVRQTLLLRRAAVNCSMVIGHFLCSIFKDIRRLSIRSHYCFVLRSKVCWTVSSVYGNRFSVAYNDLNAYSHGK